MSTTFHRHGGVDWPPSMKCPICHAERLYQGALSREQGERILRLRAEQEARDLRDMVRELLAVLEEHATGSFGAAEDALRAALGEE